jgi:hypothetical protein
MIRRTFFQTLAAAALPAPAITRAPLSQGNTPTVADRPEPALPPAPFAPEWLAEWQGLPRLPVLPDDTEWIEPINDRVTSIHILICIQLAQPFTFRYHGGSEPGKTRKVLPVMLFTTALCDMPADAAHPNPIYLLAWCRLRNAPRHFRIDRIEIA